MFRTTDDVEGEGLDPVVRVFHEGLSSFTYVCVFLPLVVRLGCGIRLH